MTKRYTLKPEVARARMRERGLTNADLVAACEINVRTLQRWFAGQLVASADAERLARALRVGTADAFSGVPEQSRIKRLAVLQRLLSSRDNAMAQAIKLQIDFYASVPDTIFYEAHPLHGCIAEIDTTSSTRDGFVPFDVRIGATHASFEVRIQLARRFSVTVANVYLADEQARLVQVWSPHTMRATRRPDGSLTLWSWLGLEARQVVFVANSDVDVNMLSANAESTIDLDQASMEHALCVRPSHLQLRRAGLPYGFDRIVGARVGRLDIPIRVDGNEARDAFSDVHKSVPMSGIACEDRRQ